MDPKAKKFEKKAKTFDNTSKQESKVQTSEKSNVVLSAPEKKFHHKHHKLTLKEEQEKLIRDEELAKKRRERLQQRKEAAGIAEELFKIMMEKYPNSNHELICSELSDLSKNHHLSTKKDDDLSEK